MGKLNRKRLHQKVTLAKKLAHYIGWGLEKAVQEAEVRGKHLDGTAIELALMNRAGRNLEALASTAGKTESARVRRNARRAEALVAHFLAEEHPEIDDLSKAIAFVAMAKKSVISLDHQISGG
ncbi:MAG: hypothetical protein ACYTGB_18215 [Planctomycetota bacterium]